MNPFFLFRLRGSWAPIDGAERSQAAGFAGNRIDVFYGTAHFEIHDDEVAYRWSATVGFCDFQRPETEVVVLGHAGCLEFLQAAFDGEQHVLELRPTAASKGIRTWL